MADQWIKDFRNAPVLGVMFFMVAILLTLSLLERLGAFRPGPPLDVSLAATTYGDAVTFVSSGVKLTDRRLIAQIVSWVYSDGTASPAPWERIGGGTATDVVRQQGERFVSALYRVPVPEAVPLDAGAKLRVCWSYEETPVYCVAMDYSAMPVGTPAP